MLDYFEMERVIEELAKVYPAQCATTWFKLTKNYKPSKEEYRDKVVEYMKQFEYLLATYPQSLETDMLKDLIKNALAREIEKVLRGNNNDVERRHKHYVDNNNNSQSADSKDTFKEVSDQEYSEKSATTAVLIKEEKSQKNRDNKAAAQEQQQQEIQYKDNIV
jgi:hypothetical protein